MRKHGIENFTFEIIEECEDSKTDERERFWIAEFDCCNSEKGYNLDVGGRGTQKDHRRSISEALKGNTHCVGRVLSEETRKKLSEAGTRRVVSTETKAKMSASMTGVLSGEKNPMFGRKGAEHPRTSITPEKIAQTKQLLSEGLTNRAIAFQVSISKTMVSRIRNGHIQ
jgi:group I intron endonuclease